VTYSFWLEGGESTFQPGACLSSRAYYVGVITCDFCKREFRQEEPVSFSRDNGYTSHMVREALCPSIQNWYSILDGLRGRAVDYLRTVRPYGTRAWYDTAPPTVNFCEDIADSTIRDRQHACSQCWLECTAYLYIVLQHKTG